MSCHTALLKPVPVRDPISCKKPKVVEIATPVCADLCETIIRGLHHAYRLARRSCCSVCLAPMAATALSVSSASRSDGCGTAFLGVCRGSDASLPAVTTILPYVISLLGPHLPAFVVSDGSGSCSGGCSCRSSCLTFSSVS